MFTPLIGIRSPANTGNGIGGIFLPRTADTSIIRLGSRLTGSKETTTQSIGRTTQFRNWQARRKQQASMIWSSMAGGSARGLEIRPPSAKSLTLEWEEDRNSRP